MEPVLIKTWRILGWTPDDVSWLEDQGFTHQVATTNVPVAIGHKVTYIRGDVGVSVETRTEQEEVLLRLKFEPELLLMLQEWVMPLGKCTLGEINWDRV